jgi:hypothetical protein
MGTTGGSRGGKATPAIPAVVGVGRSMRARDVSRPKQPVKRRPVLPKSEQDDQGTDGSSPVDS